MAGDNDKLLEALQAKREGYEEESILHQFLVDAYTGGGGFRNGQVPCVEAPYWGRAAHAYGAWLDEFRDGPPPYQHRQGKAAEQTWSHLTAFYGEDAAEYRDRIDNSVYNNLVQPIVEITHSFLTEEAPIRVGLTPDLERWQKRVTPLGHSLDRYCASVLLRGQICGWNVTVADTPAAQGASLATSKGPYLSLFWPQQVLDFDQDDDGHLIFLKLCTKHYLPRKSFLDEKIEAYRYTLWYPDRWERYTVIEHEEEGAGGKDEYEVLAPEGGPNRLGRVPATIFRWRELLSDPVRGQSQIGTVAQLARDLYNAESERRHLHRANAFSMLVVPGSAAGAPDGGVDAGPGNFLTETEDQKGIARFIGPSAAPFESYETICDERKRDIYDAALLDRGISRQAETAEARRLRFQRTNMMLRSGANALSEWERETLILVGLLQGASEEVLERIVITRRQDYAVQQFSDTLEAVLKVNELPMAPECLAEVVNRVVVDDLLGDLPDDKRKALRAANERHAAEKAPPPAPPAPPQTSSPSSPPPAPPADPPAAQAQPAQGA